MCNKMWKMILTMLLCVMLLPASVLGESAPTASIQQMFVHQGELWLTFNTSMDSYLSKDSVALLLNGQPMESRDFAPLKSSSLATSYVFLIDNAAGLNAGSFNQARHIAAHMLRVLPANSNFAVTTVADAQGMIAPVLTTDRAAVADELDKMKKLAQKEEEKSIYLAVANMNELLAKTPGINPRKVVVVFSDGNENAANGLTTSELAEKLDHVELIIHTVALTGPNHDMTLVQEMGSWSRKTGGQMKSIMRNLQVNSTTKPSASFGDKFNAKAPTTVLAQEIAEVENNLLTASYAVPEGMKRELDKACGVQMRITYNGSTLYYPKAAIELGEAIRNALNTSAAAPVATAAAEVIVTVQPAAEPTVEPTAEPVAENTAGSVVIVPGTEETPIPIVTEPVVTSEPMVTETPAPTVQPITGNEGLDNMLNAVGTFLTQEAWLGLPMWAYIAIGAVIVIAVIVVLCILAAKKKKANPNEGEDVVPLPDDPDAGVNDGKTEALDEGNGNGTQPIAPKGRVLILTDLQSRKQLVYETTLQQVTMGRDANAANWAIPENGAMSAKHCRLDFVGGQMYITDMRSTNGTQVNGQRITATVEVKQGAMITLGRTAYRFNWMDQ